MIDLKKAREICEAATPGPWKSDKWIVKRFSSHEIFYSETPTVLNEEQAKRDCEFIAFARTALTEALDEIESLRKRLELAISQGFKP